MYEYDDIDDINNDDIRNTMYGCMGEIIGVIVGILLSVGLCLCCTGCSPKVITNTITKHDTLRVVNLQHDSISVHDSVYVEHWLSGDTVYTTKYDLHTMWRDRWVYDTIYQSKSDTISQIREVKVEKQLSRWQKMRLTLGDVFLALLAAILSYLGYRLWKHI